MAGIDKVWDRLHDRAVLHAESGALVNMADAREIVAHICDGEGAVLSRGATDQLALALVRLSLEVQTPRKQPRRA